MKKIRKIAWEGEEVIRTPRLLHLVGVFPLNMIVPVSLQDEHNSTFLDFITSGTPYHNELDRVINEQVPLKGSCLRMKG